MTARRRDGDRRRRGARREDDRPRGHHPQRMQRVWRDIDTARAKLGMGNGRPAPAAAWSPAELARHAAEVVGAAGSWVGERAPARVLAAVPGMLVAGARLPCAVIEGATARLRTLPLVGRLLAPLVDDGQA